MAKKSPGSTCTCQLKALPVYSQPSICWIEIARKHWPFHPKNFENSKQFLAIPSSLYVEMKLPGSAVRKCYQIWIFYEWLPDVQALPGSFQPKYRELGIARNHYHFQKILEYSNYLMEMTGTTNYLIVVPDKPKYREIGIARNDCHFQKINQTL